MLDSAIILPDSSATTPVAYPARLGSGRWVHASLLSTAALFALARWAPAQETGTNVRCDGQPISGIQVVTHPPYYRRDAGRWKTPLALVTSLHTTTRSDVVRRFLIFREGMPCDEVRRAESERILRAQPFIADASIRAFDNGNHGVIIVVRTIDELTPVFDVRTSGKSPYINALKVGEGNLMGSGRYVAARWGDGDFRDIFGVRYIDYQFLGRPYVLQVSAVREDAGEGNWKVDLSHPFLTDQQRIAWRVTARDARDLYDFLRGEQDPVEIGIDRQFYDVGGIVRVGAPGRLSLFGLSLSREDDAAGLPPIPDSTMNYDTLLQPFGRRNNARVNFLWGVRAIDYRRARRFDALSAYQDMLVGFQFGMLIGRSVTALGSSDNDLLLAGGLVAAGGSDRTYVRFQGAAEGRQDYDVERWDGIIASADVSLYRRLTENHTVVADLLWGAAWRQRTPLQLSLGQLDGGVRGYRDSRDAGARRAVLRLEDRWFLGRFKDQADVGLALFTDAGRVWAGDAPFGVTSPVKVGAGVGFLAAIPPRSKRTWRLDLAFPLSPDGHASWEVRFSSMRAVRSHVEREPSDLRFSRELAVPASVFSWP